LVKGKVEKYKLVENKREPDIKLIFSPAEGRKGKDSKP